MVLHDFNPRLLNFLFELTKLDGPKSAAGIANLIHLEGGKCVSAKTVRNWFAYLHAPYHFRGYHCERRLSYFPAILTNRLGLVTVYAFYESASPRLPELFPMRFYAGRLYDVHSNQTLLVMCYIVPVDHLKDFTSLLRKVRSMGLCSDFTSCITGPSFRMTSPWHKTADTHGVFHIERTDPEQACRDVGKLQAFLGKSDETDISAAIKENPLVIPVFAESLYELRSSVQIWKALKAKLGSTVWAYFGRSKRRNDGLGVKSVQAIVRNLPHYGLFNQMRVVYFPLEVGRNLTIWVIPSFSSRNQFVETARTMSSNSLFTQICPISREKALLASLVDAPSLQTLFESLSSTRLERMFLFDYPKSGDLATTTRYSIFDYARYFDPQSCSWRYNQDALVSELERQRQ
jgi:hypothetical protein